MLVHEAGANTFGLGGPPQAQLAALQLAQASALAATDTWMQDTYMPERFEQWWR